MKDNLFPVSAESIKAKLKKEADSSAKDFDFLLLHYFIERLLYRLSISPYANNFILKGGLLLYTVLNSRGRATKDIDFLNVPYYFGHGSAALKGVFSGISHR